MQIVEFTAYHVRIPLKKVIRHASYERDMNDTLVVACRLDDGTVGWGEGLPRPYVTGETIESAFEQIDATDFSETFGEPIADLPDAVERCRGFELSMPDGDHRDCFGNAVRCAFELSVLDAVARRDGVPLSEVTDLLPEAEPVRSHRDRVQYSTAITSTSPFKTVARSLAFRLYKFHQVKVKVGVDGVDDVALLSRIRRWIGQKIDLRIDANEAWSCENLRDKLEPLTRFNITAVEQPVPHADVDGLRDVRPDLSIPIMLDESLCSLSDADRAIELGLCDLFNIRLSKCGGFLNSLQLAARAHEAGLGYQLGVQVGETGILSAAGRHFACSVGNLRYVEGSYERHLVRERLTVEDLTFGKGGFAPALTEPGLGVTIDPAALQRVTVAKVPLPIAVPVA